MKPIHLSAVTVEEVQSVLNRLTSTISALEIKIESLEKRLTIADSRAR